MDTKKRDAEIYKELELTKVPDGAQITSIGKLSYVDGSPKELHMTLSCKASQKDVDGIKKNCKYFFSAERDIEELDTWFVYFQRNYAAPSSVQKM